MNLRQQSIAVPALVGMGATLVAVLVNGQMASVLHVGDSRESLRRHGKLQMLTQDHCQSYRYFKEEVAVTEQKTEQNERRLRTQFVGMGRQIQPDVLALSLEPGDRLLLCTDGLTDPVSEDVLVRTLVQHDEPDQSCCVLIDAANARGGLDNITAVVIDYRTPRELELDGLAEPATAFTRCQSDVAA